MSRQDNNFSAYSHVDLEVISEFLEDLGTVFKTTMEKSEDSVATPVDKARDAT